VIFVGGHNCLTLSFICAGVLHEGDQVFRLQFREQYLNQDMLSKKPEMKFDDFSYRPISLPQIDRKGVLQHGWGAVCCRNIAISASQRRALDVLSSI